MLAVEALEQLGGISRVAPIIALSSRQKVRTAVANRAITRVARDRYALPVADLGKTLAIKHGAHLTHLSAALHHGWEVRATPALPQLLLPAEAAAPNANATFRWHDAAPSELDGWATGPMLTALLCARDLDFRDGLTVADSALRHGDITYEALNAAAEAWSHGNQEQVIAVARHATGKAANPFETALRGITVEEGYGFVPQLEIRVGSRTFHPDLVDPLNGIILEADSWGFHADKEAHERDCVRYSMLTAAGWRILRFTYDQVMFQRDYVVRCLAELMLSAAA